MKQLLVWLISPAVMGVVALVGFGLAIYTGFFYERKPELTISIDALSKVFDLYRPVGGLEVSYAGENLRASKKTLWLLTATVANSGNAEIRKGDYDEMVPLGLEIGGAALAERPSLKTSVDYLSKNLVVSAAENRVMFSPVIMESGDSFEITVLLLGSESAKPTVRALGKVAGLKTLTLRTPDSPSPSKSIWRQAIEADSLLAQPLRAFIYFLGMILFIGLLAAAIVAVTTPFSLLLARKKAAERQKKIREYRQHEELRKESRLLMELFVSEGEEGLGAIALYLRSARRRKLLIEALSDRVSGDELDRILQVASPYRFEEDRTEELLRRARLVEGDGHRTTVSDGIHDALTDLCRFLDIDPNKVRIDRYMISVENLDRLEGQTRHQIP